MKNLSLVLNIILLVAVGVLFYLHFAKTPATSAQSASSNEEITPREFKIAYFLTDSVVKHYEYLKVNRTSLENKTKKAEQEYRNRVQGLQGEINSYQRNVNSMTFGQAKAVEEDLAKKQQNLQVYQQSLSQELMNDEARLMNEFYERITGYLKKYSESNGIQVVLKYDASSDLFYGGEALDITTDVIAGLNEEYNKEAAVKAEPAKK